MSARLSAEREAEIRARTHRLPNLARDVHDLLAELDATRAERDRAASVVEAAQDPSLVLLERHPEANPQANFEMALAAQRFRAALAVFRAGPTNEGSESDG